MKNRIQTIFSIVLLFWLIEMVKSIFNLPFGSYGILPRNIVGLRGIILSPCIHHDISHLFVNTIPFIILGSLVITRGIGVFFRISLFIVLIGGAGVWIIGRPAFHIGASGLIFGYFGFIVAAGWYERRLVSILISIVVLFLYGGVILMGIVPTQSFVSWEGHLFGLLAGVLTARMLKKHKK